MNTRRLRPFGSRQVTISFGNVLMNRGSFRSRTFTGRREVPSPSSAAVSPAVNFREPGKSEAGVFMDSIERVAQNSLYHLFRIKKSFGDLPRGAAVAFIVAVDLLESIRGFARRGETKQSLVI